MIQKNAFLFLIVILFSACNDDDTLELAEIPFRIEFEIPSGLNTIEDHFFEFQNISNPTQQVLDGKGIDESSIVRISPKVVRMSVLFDNTNLGFIDECSVSLFSDEVGRKSEAFWTPEIPFNQGSEVDIPGTLIDAKDFLDQDRINVELRLDTREVNTSFITVRMDMSFSVRGN